MDECGNDVSPCAENAQCINKEGTHQCVCNPRYTGNGQESCTCKYPPPHELLSDIQQLFSIYLIVVLLLKFMFGINFVLGSEKVILLIMNVLGVNPYY